MKEVVAGLSGSTDNLYANGLHVAGQRYVLTKAEGRSLYARKVGLHFLFLRGLLPASLLSCTSAKRRNANMVAIIRAEKESSLLKPHKPSSSHTMQMA